MIKNYQLCDAILIMEFGGGFMKNPNGFGSVTKLSGKRRKPWIAKVTVGFDQNTGKQIQKSIGTFTTRADAMKQLSLYQVSKKSKHLALEMDYENAKEIQKKAKISHTFEECVRGYIEREKDGKSKSWMNNTLSLCKLLSDLMDRNIDEITLDDLQRTFDKNISYSKAYLSTCKGICSSAFKYAVMKQWISKSDDYTEYIKIKSTAQRKIIHKPFTREEIKLMMKENTPEAKMVLVYIFTGCRASELLNVTEIHDEYIVCGVTTNSGKNRTIPIHSIIKPYFKETIEKMNGVPYYTQKIYFAKALYKYGMSHTMHDTRYSFATIAKECGVKPTAIKKIMGHRIKDLTDDVSTHESLDYLKNEIEKITI